MFKKIMKTKFNLAVIVAWLVSGCGDNNGKEFLGDWVSVRSDKVTLKIERNGDNFMLRSTSTVPYVGLTTDNIPATLSADGLHAKGWMGESVIVIDQATGHLTGAGADYKRR